MAEGQTNWECNKFRESNNMELEQWDVAWLNYDAVLYDNLTLTFNNKGYIVLELLDSPYTKGQIEKWE